MEAQGIRTELDYERERVAGRGAEKRARSHTGSAAAVLAHRLSGHGPNRFDARGPAAPLSSPLPLLPCSSRSRSSP